MSLSAATLAALTQACYSDLAAASSHSEGLQDEIGGGVDEPYTDWVGWGALAVWWEGYGQGGMSGKGTVGRLIADVQAAGDDDEWRRAQLQAGALAADTHLFVIHYQELASATPQEWVPTAHLLRRALQRGAGGLDTLQAQIGNVRRSLARHSS